MRYNEKAYWISEVAELTGMNINTIRKYCLMLEQKGYRFTRDEQDRRAFLAKDITVIQEMNRLKRVEKMTLEDAVESIILRFADSNTDVEATYVMPIITDNQTISESLQTQTEKIASLHDMFTRYIDDQNVRLKQQHLFNQSLLDQLKDLDRYIDTKLKERDERLMETLNVVLETKKLLVATQEKPKKKWFHFWK